MGHTLQFDVVIPTRAIANDVLAATLSSLAAQMVPPHHIFLVCDRRFGGDGRVPGEELAAFVRWVEEKFQGAPSIDVRCVTHLTDDLRVGQQNGSYLRNYGLSMVQSPYCLLLDDDNVFEEDFCARMMAEYAEASAMLQGSEGVRSEVGNSFENPDSVVDVKIGSVDNSLGADLGSTEGVHAASSDAHSVPRSLSHVLYSPAIGWRQTDRIQSYGIRDFHYFMSWPEPMQGGRKVACFTLVWNVRRRRIGLWCVPAMRDPRVARQEDEHFYYPRMIGGNSLFGETESMRAVGFDEQIAFVMEDVDFTYRWTCTQGPIVVSKSLVIHHMERDKTAAERSFLADPRTAYQKGRNRFLFVRKSATLWEKVQFYAIGAWVQTGWMKLKIIGGKYGSMGERLRVLMGYVRGTLDGVRVR